MQQDLIHGNITKSLLMFALPMMAGNLLQQCYNIADTLIVGRFLGADALAAVGSSYTLMTFLTSILLGLCMGSGAAFSIYFGRQDRERLQSGIFLSFVLVGIVTVLLNTAVFCGLDPILVFLRVPPEVYPLIRSYLWIIFIGLAATFLYNFSASLLRAVGNSLVPLVFLSISAVLNIVLDLLFVLVLRWGVKGAAAATVISQYVSGFGILLYTLIRFPEFRITKKCVCWNRLILREITQLSLMTCIQQSVMNFGILMVQGLVNSFGPAVMAAFAAAVKIDSFAYMPVQDFGNAFSTFIAQNYGAGEEKRIRQGIRGALSFTVIFCLAISAVVFLAARQLMQIFVAPSETEILTVGVQYLRIEGSFYCGIGILFLLYGLYRAVKRPGMSVILTVISLGIRVALAYLLSSVPAFGVGGIWAAVPIGWFLADVTGIMYYRKKRKELLSF